MSVPLQPGIFLIARPSLADPNFKRTVVLLISHDEHGTLGLVVNRPTEITYADAFADQGIDVDGVLFSGGPVESNRLFVLHRLGPEIPDSQAVHDGVHFSGDLRGTIAAQAASPIGIGYRGYLGCAGWAPGQLEGEMKQQAWILCHATAEAVFHPEPSQLWSHLLGAMGGQYALMAMLPPDPELN